MGKALSARALNGTNKRVWDLWLADWTQDEIASEVGLSQQRISQILLNGAGEVEVMPRESILRSRLAQVQAKISYWSAIALDETNHISTRVAADKRVGYWWDFRARLCGEYAPDRHLVGTGQQLAIIIEGDEAEALS